MNKLTKLMLASAVLATSGFAAGTTIEEDTIIKSGWEITGSDAASIAVGKTVTMQGDNSAASDLAINGSGSLKNEGTVELHDASSIIVDSSATTPFSNIGVVDLSKVTDFSSFVVDILNSNNAKIVVPAPGDSVTSGDNAKFKFTAPSGDGESFIIEYAGGTYKLEISGTTLVISGAAGGTYADLAAVKTKLGVAVDNDVKASLQSTGSPISLLDVVNDALNTSENNNKTFDLAQTGLSSKEAALTADKTIHFGFVGAVGNDMKLTGNYTATFTGDNSGMLSKIATEGDAVFTGKAPQGALEIAGNLLVNHSGEAQTLAGEIKAGSVTIPSGTKLTFSSKLTTGWIDEVLWDCSGYWGQFITCNLGDNDVCYVAVSENDSGYIDVSLKNSDSEWCSYPINDVGVNATEKTVNISEIDKTKIINMNVVHVDWFMYVLTGLAKGDITVKD